MRVLVVSHNVFSNTSNMGKTLKSYFQEWDAEEVAQLYVHSEVPVDTVCENYYRITDKEMIKSIFTRKSGKIFKRNDIKVGAETTRDDLSTEKFYKKGKKRTPLIYFARNMWWSVGKWKTKKLLNWVDEFNPDVIFLASGDYAFIYKVALGLAKYKNIPLAVTCVDDYYIFNQNMLSLSGRIVHKSFMKTVKATMEYSSTIFTICEKMGQDYSRMFGKPFCMLATSSSISAPLNGEKTNAISYIGNVSLGRNEQLVKIGKALKLLNVDGKPECIDVYSAETNEELLKDFTVENGIRFHGRIGPDKVINVMAQSLALIHTESFGEQTTKRVMYSVSTKIADSLASGTCMLAFGPGNVASMEYLIQNEAAFCVTDEEMLSNGLAELITNSEKRENVKNKAIALAQKNHNLQINGKKLKNALTDIIKNS